MKELGQAPNDIFIDVAWDSTLKLAATAVVLPHGETITHAFDYPKFKPVLTAKTLELHAISEAYDAVILCDQQSPLPDTNTLYTIYMDSLEVLKELTKTPRLGTLPHQNKTNYITLWNRHRVNATCR